jgi:hypothetical protein
MNSSIVSAPPRLAHLELHVHEPAMLFLSWLRSLPVIPLLKSVKFSANLEREEDSAAIEDYFRCCGQELESMDLDMFGLNWEGE